MKVLAFGEILWDIIEGENHLGGAPFNFAAHLVKCGGEAAIISAVGSDDLGRLAIDQAKSLGVDVSYISSLTDYPTSTVNVFLLNGQPDYTIHESVAFDFIPDGVISNNQMLYEFDIFYFGTLAQRSKVSRNTLQQLLKNTTFKYIFFDINLRKDYFSKEVILYSLSQCTIFKINDVEAKVISNLLFSSELTFESFARQVAKEFNIETIIITAGDKGCYIWKGNAFNYLPGETIQVVDAVGAGDSFSAAFMYSYFKSRNEVIAAVIANKVGAYVASSRGAIPSYSREVKDLL